MKGIRLTIQHPDFVANDDDQRQGFLDGMVRSWKESMSVHALEAELRAYHDANGVHVLVPYHVGLREAEMVVAATIVGASLAVLAMNRAAFGVMAAYAFKIERDAVIDEAAGVLVH